MIGIFRGSHEHLHAASSVKFQFIEEHRHQFPVLRLCQVLNVSENGYYNWRKRGKSKRKRDDEQLLERIEDAYQQHGGKYGSPRIHATLKTQGISCGRKRVARLMREKELYARRKRRKARTTNSLHRFPIAPNLLQRDFKAAAPNKKWVVDITCIETREGWLYLSGVLDTYARKIVGWAMDKQHDTNLGETALQMALVARRPAAGLIHHSDRGSEYASIRYQMLLQQHEQKR
jgi:putative transposase